MSVKGKVKEATGFIKEEMNEHGKLVIFYMGNQVMRRDRAFE